MAEFLTMEQLSARYQGEISVKQLANMRYDGSGPPFFKFGRTILYSPADVDAWEAQRRFTKAKETKAGPAAARQAVKAPAAASARVPASVRRSDVEPWRQRP